MHSWALNFDDLAYICPLFAPLLFLYCFQTFGYVSWNSPENSPLFCSMAMLGSWCCVMMQSTLTHSSQGIHNFLSFPSWSQNEVKFYWFYWLYTDIHEKEKKWILLALWLQTGTEVERIEKVLPCCTAGSCILMEEMKDRDVYIKNSSHGYHVLKHNQPWPQRQQGSCSRWWHPCYTYSSKIYSASFTKVHLP